MSAFGDHTQVGVQGRLRILLDTDLGSEWIERMQLVSTWLVDKWLLFDWIWLNDNYWLIIGEYWFVTNGWFPSGLPLEYGDSSAIHASTIEGNHSPVLNAYVTLLVISCHPRLWRPLVHVTIAQYNCYLKVQQWSTAYELLEEISFVRK